MRDFFFFFFFSCCQESGLKLLLSAAAENDSNEDMTKSIQVSIARRFVGFCRPSVDGKESKASSEL